MDRWIDIRLLKRGCASKVYCLKFSEVQANFMQLKPEVDNFDNCITLRILKQKISLWADVVVTHIQCESTVRNIYKGYIQ